MKKSGRRIKKLNKKWQRPRIIPILLISAFAFVAISTSTFAQATFYTCLDNQTLQKNTTYNFNVGSGSEIPLTISHNSFCSFGCMPDGISSSCGDDPFFSILEFIGIFIALVIAAVLILKKVKV